MAEAAQTYLTLETESDFPKQRHPLKVAYLRNPQRISELLTETYKNREDEIFRCNSQHFARKENHEHGTPKQKTPVTRLATLR